ncbi:MATE family efflux transporter [Sporobolomyces koalae]|uniref:MATE family efflux transporter n=1 Tax=Sporobolomyces koalae TaxID=500713 RepID=UPI00316DD7F4
MFSGQYPSTSPASFSRETSFLQQAMNQGRTSLQPSHPPPPHPTSATASSSTSSSPPASIDDCERERGRKPRKNPSGRTSVSSAYSHERRLSPTRELTDDETDSPNRIRTPPLVPAALTERTPLLANGKSTPGTASTSSITIRQAEAQALADDEALREARQLEDEANSTAAKEECWILIRYTAPIVTTHFAEYSLMLAVVLSCGHLGTAELAGASLANMTANVTALSVIQGLISALDTLCPQAFTSDRPETTSLHALRTAFICFCTNVPQTVIFWNSERILRELLRQDPMVAYRAGQYLKVFSFALPAYTAFEVMRRWLQAQGLMNAPVIALFLAAPTNFFLNWALVWGPWDKIRIGFVGAPIATAVSINIMFVTLLVYSILYAPRTAWGGFDKRMFSSLGLNLKLGLAGIAMVGSEWWCWEIVGLATSYLGPTALAAQSVLLTTASLFYQCQYALSVAAAVRIGNLLGAQKPHLARLASRMTILIAVIVSAFNSIVLVLFRGVWGRLFSSEPSIVGIVATVLPLVAAFQLMDGLSGAMSGVLRGAGKPGLGAYINIAAYYMIGLPVGMFVTFAGPKWGLNGLWVGLTVSLSITGTILTYVVWTMEWEKESEVTRMRLGTAKRDEEESLNDSDSEQD